MSVYFTTPLYYVNDIPHIGHAYTTTVADVFARYHRLFGTETLFLTGTDEHGQKIQNRALEVGEDPKAYVDKIVVRFQEIWKELEISYDIFMRTTYDYHIQAVQDALQELMDKGDVYEQSYAGWYCVSEEIFIQEKDITDGKCPMGHKVNRVDEKNYFFRMSKYRDALIKYIDEHPGFIQPDNRKNEVLGFLRQPLEDLCISRPKTRLTWGIPLPFDKDYVTYVWFDALLNYATAVGYKQPEKKETFEKFWPNAHHLIGKDILTTHAVYWTTMLLALEVPLPKMIFAHGWWLTGDNQKMSKSGGTVVSPLDVKDLVGVEPLRYFLVRDIHFGNDAQFSLDLVVSRVNSELANNLGNLLSRTTNLINKYFDGKTPAVENPSEDSLVLKALAEATPGKVRSSIENLAPNLAVGHVVDLLNHANKFLEDRAPWKAAKTDLTHAGESLYGALEVLRIAASLLEPVMPQKMDALLKTIGADPKSSFESLSQWGVLKPGTAVEKAAPLFPRIP